MLNRPWAVLASWAMASNYLVNLEVTGRKSERTVSLPMVVVIVYGQRYLVSILGERVQWVQNVRAAGGRAALRSGGREEVHLEEVPAEQRSRILRAYLQRTPEAHPHIPVNKEAPVAFDATSGREGEDLHFYERARKADEHDFQYDMEERPGPCSVQE